MIAFLNTLDINGEERVLTKANGSVDTYAIAGDDIYFIGLRGLRLQELYLLKDEEEIQLTKFK